MSERPDIFEFTDFRKFLTAWREAEKQRNPNLTHQKIVDRLGQTNRSYFNDIEKGRKNVGAEVLDRLVKLMNLSADEAKYLRALVRYGQPATYDEREYWFEQMIQLNHTPKTLVDKTTYDYYKNWYYTTLRDFLDTFNFKNQYAEASRRLYRRISPEQVKEGIRSLKALGLIAPNEEGYLKPTGKILTTGDNVRNELLRKYQLANHDILRTILEKDTPGTHETRQITVSVSQKGMERILRRIKQLESEIISIAHKDEDDAERVLKIALHAFPETTKD